MSLVVGCWRRRIKWSGWKEVIVNYGLCDRDVISQCVAFVINNRSRRTGEPAVFYFKKPLDRTSSAVDSSMQCCHFSLPACIVKYKNHEINEEHRVYHQRRVHQTEIAIESAGGFSNQLTSQCSVSRSLVSCIPEGLSPRRTTVDKPMTVSISVCFSSSYENIAYQHFENNWR